MLKGIANTRRIACIALSVALAAFMAAPGLAAAAEGAAQKEQAQTVHVQLNQDGAVESAKTSTVMKYADGTSETEEADAAGTLPVQVSVTYKLDGKTVSAEEIAGKTGDVSIRYDYRNVSASNGSFVPFTAITALMFDGDAFADLSVTNGKTIEDEDTTIVAGYALPGLKENLGSAAADADIPEYFEVRAHATDFELKSALTIVSAGLFSDIDTSDLTLGAAADVPSVLSAAVLKLVEGSEQLTSGYEQLAQGSAALHEGAAGVSQGAGSLAGALGSAKSGAVDVASGAKELNSGLNAIVNGDGTAANPGLVGLDASMKQLNDSLADVRPSEAGGQATADAAASLDAAQARIDALMASTDDEAVKAELAQIKTEVSSAQASVSLQAQELGAQASDHDRLVQAAVTVNALYGGLDASVAALKKASEGAAGLERGSSQLAGGLSEIYSSSYALVNGAQSLESGSQQLADGTKQAVTGSKALTEGLRQFDREGISALSSELDKYAGLIDNVSGLADAAKAYDNFGGKPAGVTSSVKFIYETAPVSK